MPHKLYNELASWWPVLSAPAEYEEEAAVFTKTLIEASTSKPESVLELGSGGGNNALHMKAHFDLTLVDLSEEMLAVSKTLNPECRHLQGDMRSFRIDTTFDAVFIHDAIEYMATREDLRKAMETAYTLCKPGGVALLVPDQTRENFAPETDCGGHDTPNRSMRYLEWQWDPDPNDDSYLVDYTYTLRESDGSIHVVHDRHTLGVFAKKDWLSLMQETGFKPVVYPFHHSEFEDGPHDIFVGIKTS